MKLAGLVMLVGGLAFGQQVGDLKTTLARLDVTSAKFESAQAVVHKDLYNKVVRETTTQDGSVYFLKVKNGLQVGMKIGDPGARTVSYKDGVLKLYTPKNNCVQTISAAGHEGAIETFFALGFGGSGKDLEKNWVITDKGSEMQGGVKTERLDLVPRDAGVKNNYTHVEVWLDLERGVSMKQVFYAANTGDTDTAVYSNIRLNEKKVDTKPFEFKGSACAK